MTKPTLPSIERRKLLASSLALPAMLSAIYTPEKGVIKLLQTCEETWAAVKAMPL